MWRSREVNYNEGRHTSLPLPGSAAPASGSTLDIDPPYLLAAACQRWNCMLLVPSLTGCVSGIMLQKIALRDKKITLKVTKILLVSEGIRRGTNANPGLYLEVYHLDVHDHGCVNLVETCWWVFKSFHFYLITTCETEFFFFFFVHESESSGLKQTRLEAFPVVCNGSTKRWKIYFCI